MVRDEDKRKKGRRKGVIVKLRKELVSTVFSIILALNFSVFFHDFYSQRIHPLFDQHCNFLFYKEFQDFFGKLYEIYSQKSFVIIKSLIQQYEFCESIHLLIFANSYC
jgi:hypothetical protein